MHRYPYELRSPWWLVSWPAALLFVALVAQYSGLWLLASRDFGYMMPSPSNAWLMWRTAGPTMMLTALHMPFVYAYAMWWRMANFSGAPEEFRGHAIALRLGMSGALIATAITTMFTMMTLTWSAIASDAQGWCSSLATGRPNAAHDACLYPWVLLTSGQTVGAVLLVLLWVAMTFVAWQSHDLALFKECECRSAARDAPELKKQQY